MPAQAKRRIALEVCVDSVESAVAADRGGADRVELCSSLCVGGVSPSDGLVAETCENVRLKVHVLIRPRPGDFVFSPQEMKVMERDIRRAKELGAAGVVIGVLRDDRTVDAARTRALVEAARPLSITFHRAFDETRQPFRALELLAGLGIQRILTSGQRPNAIDGIDLLRDLIDHAGGRIGILAGSGINATNVRQLVTEAGVREVHVGSGVAFRSARGRAASLFAPGAPATSADRVRRFIRLLHDLS